MAVYYKFKSAKDCDSTPTDFQLKQNGRRMGKRESKEERDEGKKKKEVKKH